LENKIKLKTPVIAELIEVIHTEATRGDGTKEDPVRIVHQYWTKEGELLAEKDNF